MNSALSAFIGKVDTYIINPLIALLFALAIVYFLYGCLEFIMNQENEEKKTTGKGHMLWGVVGIVIMVGVFAILNLITHTIGVSGQINPQAGTVNLQ
jgi:uncharacterized membrane protein YidH (DUF202 family)